MMSRLVRCCCSALDVCILYLNGYFNVTDRTFSNGSVLSDPEGVFDGNLNVVISDGAQAEIVANRLRVTGANSSFWERAFVRSDAYPVAPGILATGLLVDPVSPHSDSMMGFTNTPDMLNGLASVPLALGYIYDGIAMTLTLFGEKADGSRIAHPMLDLGNDFSATFVAVLIGGFNINGKPFEVDTADQKSDFLYGGYIFEWVDLEWVLRGFNQHGLMSGNVYGQVSKYTATRATDFDTFRIKEVNLPEVLFFDSFTDVDDTQIRNHTPDIDYTGEGWTYSTGADYNIIAANHGQSIETSTTIDTSKCNSGLPNVVIKCDFALGVINDAQALVIYHRFLTTTDTIRVEVIRGDPCRVQVRDYYGGLGGYSTVINELLDNFQTGTITLQFNGSIIRVSLSVDTGAEYYFWATLTDNNALYTVTGLGSYRNGASASPQYDNFYIMSAGLDNEYVFLDCTP